MSRRCLLGVLAAVTVIVAGCGGSGDGSAPLDQFRGSASSAFDEAVDATLEAKTATFVIRHEYMPQDDFGIDGVYDLNSGDNTVVVRSIYTLDDDEEVHRVFERVVVDDRVFVREGDITVGVTSDLADGWIDATGGWGRQEAARGPEVARLLEALEIEDDESLQDGKGQVTATAPATLVLAVMVPDLIRASTPKSSQVVEVTVAIAQGMVRSMQFIGDDVGDELGEKRIAELITDDVTYDPSGLGSITVRLTNIGGAVDITDPTATRS